MSPTLAGGFLTSEPPGQPLLNIVNAKIPRLGFSYNSQKKSLRKGKRGTSELHRGCGSQHLVSGQVEGYCRLCEAESSVHGQGRRSRPGVGLGLKA